MKRNKRTIEFERFFKDNYSRFFYFAYDIIGDRETCRDIVHDAFEYAWKKHSKKTDVQNWVNYLYSFIRNKCIDYIRKQTAAENYATFCHVVYSEHDDYRYEDLDEQIELMRELFDELTPQKQLILQRYFFHKRKYREVAEELDISISTVRNHIVSALETLREGLTDATNR